MEFILPILVVAAVAAVAVYSFYLWISEQSRQEARRKEREALEARFERARKAVEWRDLGVPPMRPLRELAAFLDGGPCHADALTLLTRFLREGEPRERLAAAKLLSAYVERLGKGSDSGRPTVAILVAVMFEESEVGRAVRSTALASGAVMAGAYREEVGRREELSKLHLRLESERKECTRRGHHQWERKPGYHVCERCFTSEEHDFSVHHFCGVCGYSPDEC